MSVNRYNDIELGILQMQVLWLLQRPTHGYELIKKLNDIKTTKIGPSVLYPVLGKLEKMKLIESKKSERRKVYKLTANGRKVMSRSCLEFCRTFEGIFKSFVCERCR